MIQKVYQTVFDGTESFRYQRIGEDLAYLLGAIARNGKCDWPPVEPIVKVLRQHFGKRHAVWRYINVIRR